MSGQQIIRVNKFDGVFTSPNITGNTMTGSLVSLTIGVLSKGSSLYLDTNNLTHFKAQKNGMYNILAYFTTNAGGTGTACIYLNNSLQCTTYVNSAPNIIGHITQSLYMNINDYIEIKASLYNTSICNLQNATFRYLGN